MKKSIISALLFVLSVCDLLVQDFTAGPAIVKSFEQSFKGATNVRFEPFKNTGRV